MFKKTYIAIISDNETGKTKGSMVVRGFKWKSALSFHRHITQTINSNTQHISHFARIK